MESAAVSWNANLVNSTFHHQIADSILQIPKVSSTCIDCLCWKPSIHGICSTKEAYKYLSAQTTHSLPNQGPRAISSDALSILNRIWQHKTIPPRIKAFA